MNKLVNKKYRIALYARVSTAALHNGKSQDPNLQLRDMKTYVKLHHLGHVVAEYIDKGVSSAKKIRPQLERLKADAKNHRFDAVIVWRFDRFARSAIELATALDLFKSLQISFVSMSEQVDTSTPTGELVLTILGAVAKMEREMIRERVSAGIRNRRAQGKHIGPPGAKKITKQMFTQVHKLRKRNVPFHEIGKRLKLATMTVWKISRRKYL